MKVETKVGLLFLIALCFIAGFAYAMGIINPFSNSNTLNVMYNYAGGIEEGSPVRVMGIKVGKVKKIEFDPNYKSEKGEEVKLKVIIQIEKKAWSSIRQDSRYYINLAGVIGEKFLEISPGSLDSPELKVDGVVRGEDPPRIDQLISQSYGLAGRILNMVDKNEVSVTNIVGQLDHLLNNFNKTLTLLDKTSQNKEINRLITNAIKISDDLAYLTGQARSKKAEESYALIHKLLFRLDGLDGPTVRKFLQEEGVKAHIF
jgi:phospholipid/cholesterol/gamma-HCH transport system substrate-binding protein